MKKFTKLFLSCAAVAAVTAAVATSAMAATVTGNLAGTYDEETGKLTLTTAVSDTATVLVIKGTNTTSVTADDVLYIDQTADGSFGEMGLKGASAGLDDGTYTVMVGSYDDDDVFSVTTGKFVLGDAGEEIKLGNVNGDSSLDSDDATCILYYDASYTDDNIGDAGKTITISDASNMAVGTYASGDTLLAGNVNGDSKLNSDDATCILYYDAGYEDAEFIGNVGVTITGTIAE